METKTETVPPTASGRKGLAGRLSTRILALAGVVAAVGFLVQQIDIVETSTTAVVKTTFTLLCQLGIPSDSCSSPRVAETAPSTGLSGQECKSFLGQIVEQKQITTYCTQDTVDFYEKAVEACKASRMLIDFGALAKARASRDVQTACGWYENALKRIPSTQ
jgi:hypothetical protein